MTLDYTLAKELKVAGFKQGSIDQERPHSWYDAGGDLSDWWTGDDGTYIPTLSELIEACGEELIAIQREYPESSDGKTWCAVREWYAYYPPEVERGEYGNSPEEAVARLWLAINKKS